MQVIGCAICCSASSARAPVAFRTARPAALEPPGRGKTAGEIDDEIGRILKADVQAHKGPAVPAVNRRVGEGKALVAAPGGADAKQAQAVDEAIGVGLGDVRLERYGEQPIGSREVALPKGVTRIAGEGWVEDAIYRRLPLQPGDDLLRMRLVHGDAGRRRAQALERAVGIVGADRLP